MAIFNVSVFRNIQILICQRSVKEKVNLCKLCVNFQTELLTVVLEIGIQLYGKK